LAEVPFGGLKQYLQDLTIDRYIAVSDDVAEWLTRDLHVSRSKVRVVRNGVSAESYRGLEGAAVKRIFTSNGRPIIFTSARLHEGKGHVYLLQAAKLIPEALFVFAGDGPERGRLEAYARQIGVEGQVIFLGHRNDVPQLLAACDMFVLPSLYEALGLSILEAMAAGKPVVATAVGGIKESVIDGVTGLLVPPRNPESLADAIRRLLYDRALATRIAESGRTRAVELFSSDAMAQAVIRVYDELIARDVSATVKRPLESAQPRASV
jgi:glycosyltransferase involved in cell wall biosynthesis